MEKHPLLPLVLAFFLLACNTRSNQHSPLFRQIFFPDSAQANHRMDSTNFRGLVLGQPIPVVKAVEKAARPMHEDELGLSYEIQLSETATLLLDYYSDRTNSRQPRDRLTSIVADVLMKEEVETAHLYEDIEAYFNERYGISDGGYGQLVWTSYTPYTNNMEVRLILNENKTQITINFIDLQPDATLGAESMISPAANGTIAN